jgi:TP901 family phage tail tape measure protein
MADVNANIGVSIDTSAALANLKNLQRQISAFHTSMAKSGAAASAVSAGYQQNLINSINQSGKFSASMKNIKSTTDSFTNSLEKNKLSMREYFRYSAASTKSFGRFFGAEFDTINKVARERVKDLQTQYIKMGRDANGAIKAIAVRPLTLDMENLGTRTQIAAQRQGLLNQMLKQGSTNLLNFGKNTQWAGRQLMVGFTIPLTMFGALASKTFMDLEKQAIRFKRVYGELFTTTEETNRAVEDIKSLANEFTKYGIAVSKTMELAADIAAMGKMGADLNAQVAETTRLAVLGGVEQAEALKATISLTDAFGVSAEELAGKIDFLNAVENQTVTSIEDLTIAIPKAGPVVRQLGGDIQDLTFFLTAMREGGINASESANALKSGLASMINPAEKSAKFLENLGINLKGIVEANKGDIKGTVIAFAEALDTLDPLNRARAIEQLFGKFQFSRLSTLFQNVTREGNQASRVLQLTRATTEELAILSERELKRVEDSPMFKFQKAIEDIKLTLVPLGEAFLKAVTPVLEFGASILEKFNELDAGAKQFVVGLTAVAGVIGPVFLMGFGLIANGVANIIKGFVFFKTALNKAATSSTELGVQTEYMTQQQLEAAAVASSLDQVHQKLRQTFTSEAAAVNALTAAYQRSIAAQARMTGGVVGRTRPPGLKLASGIMSVPGPKGAGDVVPAMLSPGEAVIPAKQSRKYSGIISSLIADNVPGFRVGRNPFASMLGRSRVAVRMKDKDFISSLRQDGKDARYKSAFETQTGADYIRESGSKTTRQRELRSAMERDVFGLDPKTTSPSSRPTYGYARTPILLSLVNRLFGLKGKNFNSSTTNIGDSLDKYGNIDLITKGSVAKRSSAFAGDALVNYNWATQAGTSRRIPDLNRIIQNTGIRPAPMRGASSEQLKGFERLGSPFGSNRVPGTKSEYWTNPEPAYVETYTPGGFSFKEIDKIIARDPAIAKQLKQELRSAGLGAVRVVGPGFVSRLFKNIGVPGFNDGSKAVTGQTDGKYWLDFLGKRFDLTGPSPRSRPQYYADNLPKTIEMMQSKGRSNESILTRIESLYGRKNLSPSNLNKTYTASGKKQQYTVSGGSPPWMNALTSNVKASGMFNDELEFLQDRAKRLGISDSQLARFSKLDASHFIPKGTGVKNWKDISKIGPDIGGINNYLNRVGGNLGKYLMALNDKDLRHLKINRKELEKLVAGEHPKTKRSALALRSIAEFDENVWSPKSRDKDVRKGAYQATLTKELLDRRFNNNLYERGLRSYADLIDQGKIEDTRRQSRTIGGSDEKVPAGTRVSGGSASDTRMAAVTPGETILTKKTNKELMRGRGVMLPGIGRLATLGSSNFPRLPGFADGFPEGQTPDRRSSGISQSYGMSSKDWDKATKEEQTKLRAQRKRSEAAEKQRRLAETNSRISDEQKIAEEKKKLAIKEEKRQARQTKMRGMGGKVAGGVGVAAMVGVVGGSMMGGQIGEIANQLMMPVMMLSMMLPMLTNPIGLVVAGLAAVVGGFVAVHLALENIRRETAETTRSLSSGKDAMSEFAEIAGTVTPSEFMAKRREMEFSPFTVQTGKTTFGQSFVQTDAGQNLISQFEEQTEKFGRSKAIESLQKKLTTAVATGVLSPEQAKSIANSLGQKLNDYNITANINASIQSILGPDGKLLQGNTIKIYTEFIQESGTGLTGIGGILQTDELTGDNPIWWWDTEKVAKKEGEAAGMIANFYDENQQVIDAFDAENLKNIDSLYARGDFDAALKAEEKYQEDRKNLINSYNVEIRKLMEDFSNVKGRKPDAILRQLIDMAKEIDPAVGTAADKLREALAAPIMVGPGAAPRAEQVAQREAFKEAKLTFIAQVAAGNMDPKTFTSLIGMFDPTTSTGQATLGVLAKINTEIGPSAVEQLDTVFKVLENPGLAAEIAVKIDDKSPEEGQAAINTLTSLAMFDDVGIETGVVLKFFGENMDKLDELTLKFQDLSELKKKGMLDVDSLVKQKIITEGDAAAFKENSDFFNDLDASGKETYTQVYLTKFDTIAPDELAIQKRENPWMSDEMAKAAIAARYAEQYVTTNPSTDTTTVTDPNAPGATGAKKENPYKDVIKDLKELRQNAVNATGGIKELLKWLGKGKDMRPFKGTLNALVAGGTTEEFQGFVTGLEKSEQNSLFKVTKGVAELTNKGKALQKAFNEISIGRFVIEQQRSVANAKNQDVAAKRLIAAGMDTASAYEAVEDATFAAGIAAMKLGKKGREELKTIVDSAKEAEAAILKAMSPDQLAGFLKESLDAQIDKIQIDFEVSSAGNRSIAAAAQSEIAALQFQIDDYQAGIQEIEWQETAINEKYDKRFEALDRIKQANAQISEQQRSQLSIAQSITQGDVAGAARAIQELREKQAEQAIERQQNALDLSREKELASLRSTGNQSRKQLEDLILAKQKEIFAIEEKRLEPANEQIRLLEVQKEKTISNLELQKSSYDALVLKIDSAKFATKEYVTQLRTALALLQEMAGVPKTGAASPGERMTKETRGAYLGNVPGPNYAGTAVGMVGPGGNYVWTGSAWVKKAGGGMISYYPMGGKIPYKSLGGNDFHSVNSDSVPAMLTPGEYVIKRQMVNKYGTQLFDKLNSGAIPGLEQGRYKFHTPNFSAMSSNIDIDPSANSGGMVSTSDNSSVYNNYSVQVSVRSDANPNEIANTVISKMRQIESQKIRGNRL